MCHKNMDEHVPCFHPGGKITDSPFCERLLLRDHHVAIRGSRGRSVKEGEGLRPCRAGYTTEYQNQCTHLAGSSVLPSPAAAVGGGPVRCWW